MSVPTSCLTFFLTMLQTLIGTWCSSSVVLIDVSADIVPHLLPYDASNPYWDMVQFFDISHPDLFPIPDALVAAAWDWILSPAAGDRVAYYSAEEGERVPICPMDEEEDAEEREETQPKAKAKAMPSQRPPAPGPSSTTGGKKPAVPKESNPKARKPTVASLATSLEGLSVSIPALVAEVAALSERTQAMEENIQGGQRLSALRRPLRASDLGGSAKPSSGTAIKTLLQEMPPPKTLRPKTLTLAGPPAPATAADALMEEREETAISGSTDLARAVLAQSTALTALVSKAAARMGLTVCTPIELSDSRCYDLRNLRLVQWVVHMLQVGRFKSIMLEPPCTTWSPAAHPAVRSYSNPRGFNMLCQKTLGGNITAFRSLLIAYVARENERPCLLETPFLSKMAWLSVWRFLLRCKSFQEAVCASCAFGSPHLKQFRLLTYGLDAEELTVRCKGGHKHLRIEGKLTKASAVYVPALAEHFARAFYKALRRIDDQHENEPTVKGLESVAINDVLMSGSWQLEHCWHWKVAAHMNVLESNAYLSLLKRLARHESEALRFVALLDSRVAKGAHAKGRSTSWALGPSLRKAAAVSVGAGLYSSLGFAPTRLNTADDPTRDVSIRPSSERSCLRNLSLSQIRALQSVQLSRSAANWVRLWILLSLCDCSDATSLFADHIFRHASSQSTSEVPHLFAPFVSFGLWTFLLICLWLSLSCLPVGRFLVWGTPKEKRGRQPIHRSHCPLIVFAFIPLSQAMPYGSGATGDRLRAQRRASVELVADRAVRPHTRSQRDNLLVAFDSWLGQWGWSLATAVDVKDVDAEFVARLLVQYGRELYYSGKPYGYYSETINGVAARRPALRRQLAHAWDLAFAWVADEPVAHHPPIPKSILLALCGLALLWGWPCEAAIFLMSWSGLLRIGEAISATRADLILPADAAPGTSFALLRIRAPKTRGVGARHQAARFDQKDVVELLDAVFYDYPRDKKLWSYSSTTLRKRMNSLQGALGLVGTGGNSQPPYDLGSFRPGGATYYLQLFEDPDFVRRRGRWLSHKSMEIYLQEVATATFHHRLSTDARRRISEVVLHFPRILVQSCWFLKHGIPPCSWCHLWSTPA